MGFKSVNQRSVFHGLTCPIVISQASLERSFKVHPGEADGFDGWRAQPGSMANSRLQWGPRIGSAWTTGEIGQFSRDEARDAPSNELKHRQTVFYIFLQFFWI